jgi:hypothetical protein
MYLSFYRCRTKRSGWGFQRMVNRTDDATTQDPTRHSAAGSTGANAAFVVFRKSALLRLSAPPNYTRAQSSQVKF